MIIYAHVAFASVAISIIKIILSGTIGAIAGFYVKYGRDEYSNSIRWSRTGGFCEMVVLCGNSFRRLSTSSRVVMVLMISTSVSTLFVTIILGASVSRTRSPAKAVKKGVFTQQPVSTNYVQWTDWIAYMEADATMEGTMSSLLNGTIYNPSPSPWTIYTPPIYTYNVPCTETGAVISNTPSEMPFQYPSLHDNCKSVFLTIESQTYNWDDKTVSDQLISPGLHMMVAPMSFLKGGLLDIEPLFYAYSGKLCFLKLPTGTVFNAFPKDGLTALPRTDSTRCQFASNDSFVVTATVVKFAVNHLIDFDKVTFMVFDDPSNLPLLKAMRTAINNGTFASPTNNSTMVLLTNMSDNVDFLVCASKFLGQPNDMGLICTYMATVTIATQPQSWDPIITADLNWNSTLPADPDSLINQNDISVYHMPPLGSGSNMTTYSAAHLLEATANVTHYFASLGHNVIMNNDTGRLYVLYDAVELTPAFEVSTTLLVVLICIVVICSLIWGISEKFCLVVFNGSLYKLIYTEIKLKEKKTPMLMSFKQDTLAFNGYQVIPDLDEQPYEPLREAPVIAVNIESTRQLLVQEMTMQEIPMQQLSARKLPMDSEILVHNQSLTSETCPTTTTVAPVGIDTNNSASTTNVMSLPTQTSSMPTMPLSILPRPLEYHRNFIPVSTIQRSALLHTTSHSIQDVPSSPSTNQESTLV